MKYYITKTEKTLIKLTFIILTIVNMILCFKGMKLEIEKDKLEQEKEALMEIIEMKKGMLEGI